ncbi:RnfABCDGE type electron transport complex subunit B [Candidatus Ishikawella capsulata]|uniref:Member of SoxR-reducing complex n=1 Tax=Candidatus Ishikawaella capsulata Mpkobe TaxID=476281 RepID=C5WD77_9ENTR|nr:RnfABCDGE type electron transport complex subunit B [Candidatus Ishikawaella capsulata]BAH83283.1 member of SoxR-reducing complex [Candidatus Ishikawaella capsulata Mpkobe]
MNICISIIEISILSLLLGAILGYVSHYFLLLPSDNLSKCIDDILPQKQCRKCGYADCFSYANAISSKNEQINKCIPGGNDTIRKIAYLLNLDIEDVSLVDGNEAHSAWNQVAWINEVACIGCTKCVQICPVDAIIGSKRTLHTVMGKFCTGCELCIHSCPTNCIQMKSVNIIATNHNSS